MNDDDVLVLHEIINNVCKIKDSDGLSLSKTADNHYLFELFKENLTDSTFVKREQSKLLLSKGSAQPNEKNIKVLYEVFTQENYKYIEGQISTREWKQKDIKDISCRYITIVDRKNSKEWNEAKSRLSISKPIYTKNSYALVLYSYKNMMMLSIMKMSNGKWSEVQFIGLGIS